MFNPWPKIEDLAEIAQIDEMQMMTKAAQHERAGASNFSVPTFFGTFSLDATAFGVASLYFPEVDESEVYNRYDYYGIGLSSWGKKMAIEAGIELMGYAVGEQLVFETPVDLSYLTPFQQDVLHAVRSVPFGETITYKELAFRAEHPKKVAAVANVLKHNPLPIFVPCHRVLPSKQGSLGVTSAPAGWKAYLLNHEGIEVHEACA